MCVGAAVCRTAADWADGHYPELQPCHTHLQKLLAPAPSCSTRTQASWIGMAEKAYQSAPRLAFCATTLAFHSAGLLGMTLKWAKKPKKH